MKKGQRPAKRAHSPKGTQRPGRYVAIRKRYENGKRLGNTAVLDSAFELETKESQLIAEATSFIG